MDMQDRYVSAPRILGYLNTDNFSITINTILMVTKHYIFVTSLNVTARPNIHDLLKLIKKTYNEQSLVAKINNKFEFFCKTWSKLSTILENL